MMKNTELGSKNDKYNILKKIKIEEVKNGR